ncbi:hypothetical protein DW053_05015 [Veillonella sp. AF42-16]|nr:hypothetical protein DW053_05015 [Veillonella sp. AF42-16]
MLRNEHLSFFYRIEINGKNISINLKITLAILNDICYYIDKDRYRFGDKYTDNNIIVTLELN